jgi:small subunit ribosomal protein S16
MGRLQESASMVRIRMKRLGRRRRPFYRINAVDVTTKRDGKFLEQLGWYDPLVKDEAKAIVLEVERIKHWLAKGAQPSDTVMNMLVKREIIAGDAAKEWHEKHAARVKAKQEAAAKKAANPEPEKKKK